MRSAVLVRRLALVTLACLASACGRAPAGFTAFEAPAPPDAASSTTTAPPVTSAPPPSAAGGHDAAVPGTFGPQTVDAAPAEASVVTTTTIYANTDTTLFSMDPTTQAVTPVGVFTGLADAGYDPVTDLAVNAEGAVYVNTESAVYLASLPSVPGPYAPVTLTRVSTIAAQDDFFYALAFTPPNALGSGTGEVLIGGDGAGELWSIEPTSGATQDLGGFGPDPGRPGNVFALSGDVVFYTDAAGEPTGLATIRSCSVGKDAACIKTSDLLAGVDMAALAAAYTSRTRAPTLLSGIYGAGPFGAGQGTGYGELFGLGAWGGSVFAFSRNVKADASAIPPATAVPPLLVSIDPTTGIGAPAAAQSFPFTDGWSGAGVTTTVTVTIPQPPPVPQ